MKATNKRLISLILAALLVIGAEPVAGFAAEEEPGIRPAITQNEQGAASQGADPAQQVLIDPDEDNIVLEDGEEDPKLQVDPEKHEEQEEQQEQQELPPELPALVQSDEALALFERLMACETLEEIDAVLGEYDDDTLNALIAEFTPEQQEGVHAHIGGLEEIESGFSQDEWATFTQGLYVGDKLLFGEALRDYLFWGLLEHAFKLAVNQMSIEQAGSLEGMVTQEQAKAIAKAMCHGGYKISAPTASTKMRALTNGLKTAGTTNMPAWPAEGAIKLDKGAQAVSGQNNLWEVALGIKGKNYKTTSDVVLVIDKSGSMAGTKIANTKLAAKAFGNALLVEGKQTRIAIVTYSNRASWNNVFYTPETKTEFNTAIDAITASEGTHQQAGIHLADSILYSSNSTGVLKNIVILSDGEPTYSYKFTGTATWTGCGYNWWGSHNWGGQVDTNTVSITGCDYNTTVGNGSDYSVSNNVVLAVTCEHGYSQTINKSYGNYNSSGSSNNGVATIWEAAQTKAKGTTIYSIALQAGSNGESVMKACASNPTEGQGYFKIGANDDVQQKLANAFTAIAGSIEIAASNGVVTDPMGEKVQLHFSGASPVITNVLATYNAGNAHIYISQGSASYNPNTETITWNVGNVHEGIDPVMKYKVSIKAGVTVNTGETIDTNEETTFNYTDYQQNSNTIQFFPIPQVTVGGGNILVHWYRVNENGEPVNAEGIGVPSPNLAMQLADAAYFEYDGSTGLVYNTPYTVSPKDFSITSGLEDYSYYGKYILNDGSLTAGSSVKVTLNQANSNQHVWFAYAKAVNNCTLTIKKSGWDNKDTNASFIFKIDGEAVVFYEVLQGNGTKVIKGLPKGSYTVTEAESWSWRYKKSSISWGDLTGATAIDSTVTFTSGNGVAAVTITNTRDNPFWLSGESSAVNKYHPYVQTPTTP